MRADPGNESITLPDIHEAWNASLKACAADAGLPRWRVEEIFAYGACSVLARTLAEHTGLEIGIVTADEGYAHAFVKIGARHALDAFGVRTVEAVLATWKEDDDGASIRAVEGRWFEDKPVGSLDLTFSEAEELAAALAADFTVRTRALLRFRGPAGHFADRQYEAIPLADELQDATLQTSALTASDFGLRGG